MNITCPRCREITQQRFYGPCSNCRDALNHPTPIGRNSDPWTSKLAAERIEPKRETRKAKVLALLRAANGDWVDGHDIASPGVGGSEGLRRLRELRADNGWPIERRPHPQHDTSWQYRLTGV